MKILLLLNITEKKSVFEEHFIFPYTKQYKNISKINYKKIFYSRTNIFYIHYTTQYKQYEIYYI